MNSVDAIAVLSEDQTSILKKFRDTVQDILQPHHDDYFLLRWLRARDFDIAKSEKMIRESFKLRKKLNIDDLLSGSYIPPEVFKNYCPTAQLGFDKEGCLVRYLMAGMCDLKGFAYSLHTADLIKAIMYIFEGDSKTLEENNAKTGSREARTIYIVDYRDFSLRQFYDKHVIQVTLQILRTYQDNYPETLKVAYLTNVPLYFHWFWNMIKPFVDPVTLKKIKIYRTDNESWKDELLPMVNPEIIPAFIGGTLCDPDGNPTCQTLVRWTDLTVPTSYYLKDKCSLCESDPGVKSVVVQEKSHFEIKILVEKPGSILKWEFQTKNYNIKFGIFFEETKCARTMDDVPPEVIVPVEKMDCHLMPEGGEFLCETTGLYILRFDNSYSWFTSKHLLYKVTVSDPEEINGKAN